VDNTNGASGIFDIETIDAGRLLRIGRRSGQKGITPLLLFNDANLELLEPFVAKLDNSIPVIIFDVPGSSAGRRGLDELAVAAPPTSAGPDHSWHGRSDRAAYKCEDPCLAHSTLDASRDR